MGWRRNVGYNPGLMLRGKIGAAHSAAGWAAFVCVFVLAAVGAAASSSGSAKLDPALTAWLEAGTASTAAAASGTAAEAARAIGAGDLQVVPSLTGEVRVKVLACATGEVGTTLGGVPVSYSAGTVASLLVTREELEKVLEDERVSHVEASWRTREALNVSVPAIGVDKAHAASPAVEGAGVIVGFVDTGIDFRHLDFRYDGNGDGSEESSRILELWDQTYGLFGVTYGRDDIEADLASGALPGAGTVKSVDRDGHGTHVAGIAAGDGSSSTAGFVGVAPAAWIVAVKTTFFTADILEAVGFVFDQAQARGLPAVVNLSLGGQSGPHDGTSAFERGLDELAQGPGRAIVVSAGNEGDLPIHVSGTLQGGARTFDLKAAASEISLQLWYPGRSRFSVAVVSPSGASASAATGTGSGFVPSADGVAYIDNASGGTDPNNDDHEALVRITGTSPGARWHVTVHDDSGGGRFDGWVITNVGEVVGGDSSSTVDEPGNARNVITVGAFDTKATWPSQLGDQDDSDEVTVGGLSGFSSQGPTRDGRTKPDIAAPGTWICSALSTSATSYLDLIHPDGVHVMHRGTSMAAPHVSGTIALLLEQNPQLTAGELRQLLTAAAKHDAYTGSVPNERWGYGKLDAWAALLAVEASEPPPVSGERPTVNVEHNPAIDEATFAYALPQGTHVASLRVYDIAGARVFDVALSLTGSSYIWDLAADDGDRLACGLYLYVVASDEGSSDVGRLVIAP